MADLRFDMEYTRCPEFMEFIFTPAYGIWFHLAGQVIRRRGEAPGAQRMYHIYYMGEGWLCASYSVENIAINCRKFQKNGKPNKSWVSRNTRKLEKMGIIKKHKDGRKIIYQLGYIDKEGCEVLFLDEYFTPKAYKAKKYRMDCRTNQRNKLMSEHCAEQLRSVQL